MKKTILSIVLLCAYTVLSAQTQKIYFATYPTLSPDGTTVVFSYAGDLWRANTNGGPAYRLTAMEGIETRPRISPNGQWLAFTGAQYGNNDVFLMPLAGGVIRQLTYHEAGDDVDGWSWDNTQIYFTSDRYNRFTGFTVSRNGDTPKRLFENYFNTIHNLAEHPGTGEIFFNESWESNFFANRKRYKGAFNPDIKSYNPETKQYKTYTAYEGKDLWTTIDQQGQVYFVSDEANGEYNLYTFLNGQKTQLTNFDTSIKHPFVSANGKKVVFERDYQLFIYDVASKTSEKVNISIYKNEVLPQLKDFEVEGKISAFDVSSDNKKLAFVSRGELFVTDIKGKLTRQLKTQVTGRVLEVKWLADNKSLIFNQTVQGYQNWFTMPADKEETARQLTSDQQNNRNLTLNEDRTKGVYLSGRNEVRLMDMKSFASETVVTDELWALFNPLPYFSPDGKYIVFVAKRNFEDEIMVYQLETKDTLNLTHTGLTETEPFWSPDGKYIYFVASREKPSYPYGLENARIYRIALEKHDKPFVSESYQELFEEKKEDDEENIKDKKKKKEEEKQKIQVRINPEKLYERWAHIGPDFGTQSSPNVIQKDDKTYVLYASDHEKGTNQIWKTTLEPFETPKTEKIENAQTSNVILTKAEDNYYLLIDGTICQLKLDENKTEKIEISHTFRRNLKDEFNQMFYETWANMEENFYDADFHEINWEKTKEKYEAYLPYINSRADLRLLTNDMLGELNTSHYGFQSSGDEEDAFYKVRTLGIGLLFEENNPYLVASIVENSVTDKTNIDIQPGDLLTAINHEPVDTRQNREFYFTKPSMDDELSLTFTREGKKIDIKIHPESYNSVKDHLYDSWIRKNRKHVDEKSEDRIAYVHMKNMGSDALEQFLIDMSTLAYQKDALNY